MNRSDKLTISAAPSVAGGALLLVTVFAFLGRREGEAHIRMLTGTVEVDRISGDDPRRQQVYRSLNRGRDQGVFEFESIEAAFDLVIGTSIEGARRISRTGQLDGACIRETVVMLLLGLGMQRPAARRAVDTAWQLLQGASEHLHWWKPVIPV